MNFRGQFGRCSYHIAQKTAEVLQQKVSLTGLECEIHNNKIPTYKQVQNSPELQKRNWRKCTKPMHKIPIFIKSFKETIRSRTAFIYQFEIQYKTKVHLFKGQAFTKKKVYH